jgi:uncharacterized membrane protein YidH (DUF202 family)
VLAAGRTRQAWTRTALAFGAVGGIILKTSLIPGLVVLATSPVIYVLGLLARPDANAEHSAGRLRLISGTIIAVALVAMGVAVFGRGHR